MIIQRCKTEHSHTVIRKSWLKDGKAYRHCWEYGDTDPRIREWGDENMRIHKEDGPAREYKDRPHQYYLHGHAFSKEEFDILIKAAKENK